MAAISNLCVVETVKSWRGKGDEEEGVVAGAEEGNNTKFYRALASLSVKQLVPNQDKIKTWTLSDNRRRWVSSALAPQSPHWLRKTETMKSKYKVWPFVRISLILANSSKITLSIFVGEENTSLPSLEPTKTPSWKDDPTRWNSETFNQNRTR